jgi:ectoine hydroxylase-related dioxygenase (phytanoyl-CoA dioxygenase family)
MLMTAPACSLTIDQIETFRRDGIVCLRGVFDPAWVEDIRALVEADMADPSGMVKNINAEGATGFFFGDTFVCHHHQGFKRAVLESPAAQTMAGLFGADKVNLLFDQILVKEPNTSTPTLWHQDITYWPVAGSQVATLWLALDSVTRDTGAVEYLRGSHLWNQRYLAVSFDPNQTYEEELPEVPDIESEREKYDIVSFDLEPGDCTIHDARLLHGAPPNASKDQRRRAYLQRWVGDDVTYNPRPNLQRMLRDPGIAPGGPLDCDLFPVAWQRERTAA